MGRLEPLPWVLLLLLLYEWANGAAQEKDTRAEFQNATVTQIPAAVSTGSPLVNLTCSALKGQGNVMWMWTKVDFSSYNISILNSNTTLQINQPNKTHNGKYLCTMSNGSAAEFVAHPLYVYFENVTVIPSSEEVIEGSTASINLTCSSSAVWEGSMTWLWDGKSINTLNTSYILLDDNKTLQINQPRRTHNGIYTCVIANPASSERGEFTLRVSVSTAFSPGVLAGIVIGSVFGALLLVGLIVLIICCSRKKGKKEKWLTYKDVVPTVSGQVTDNAWKTRNVGYARWNKTDQDSMGYTSSFQSNTLVSPQKTKNNTLV